MALTFEQRQQIKRAISDRKKANVHRLVAIENGTQNHYKGRLKTAEDWAEQGLEELEPGNTASRLRCMECGKVTERCAPRRHYLYCSRWIRRDRK